MKKISTLAIETSCDDTSLAIVSFENNIFSVDKILAYSQVQDHQKYGGVVPEFASRLHSDKIIEVLNNIGLDLVRDVDFVTVTAHPGLPWSLLVGQSVAYMLWEWFQKPVLGVNHVQWHIFSIFLERDISQISFPLAILTVSGWHNDLYYVVRKWDWQISDYENIHHLAGFDIYRIWQSIDDAAWEAFDKVSRMLWGPYPGGPWISNMADLGKDLSWKELDFWEWLFWIWKFFKRIWLDKEKYDFSFSWIKSQVYNFLKKYKSLHGDATETIKQQLAYEFQESVVEVLSIKLLNFAQSCNPKTIAICGWVSANKRRRDYLNQKAIDYWDFDILKPTKILYSTDNAGMIWVVGIMSFLKDFYNIEL